jgi:hypothetical protein
LRIKDTKRQKAKIVFPRGLRGFCTSGAKLVRKIRPRHVSSGGAANDSQWATAT